MGIRDERIGELERATDLRDLASAIRELIAYLQARDQREANNRARAANRTGA
jgi:hypothetical protein